MLKNRAITAKGILILEETGSLEIVDVGSPVSRVWGLPAIAASQALCAFLLSCRKYCHEALWKYFGIVFSMICHIVHFMMQGAETRTFLGWKASVKGISFVCVPACQRTGAVFRVATR